MATAMKQFLFLFFLFYLHGGIAFSQPPRNFTISHYTTENGLLSNGIKGLQWDEQTGFLWIATEAGVSRFNGLDFAYFTTENTPAIEAERMLFLVKNNKGKIYTADQSGNILYVKNNKLVLYHKSGDAQQQLYDKQFTISISDTFFNDPSSYKGSKPISLLYDYNLPTSDTSTFVIYANKIYTLRMGIQDVISYRDSNLFARTGFKLNEQCFFVNQDLIIHELNDDPSLNKPANLVNPDGSSFQYLDKSARIYWTNGMVNPVLINKNKAWILLLSGSNVAAVEICDEIPTDALIEYVQYSPQKEILFMGTDSKGLIVISRNRVDAMKSISKAFNERNAYYSQIELDNGNVLTNEGHVIGKNPSSTIPIKGKFTYYVSSTADSAIWYSQDNASAGYVCLHNYNIKTRETKVYPKIRGAEIIIKEITGGKKMLVTEFGIGWLKADSIEYLYRHPQISYNNVIYKMEEIEPGTVLLATCSGILKYSTSSKKMDTVFKSIGSCFRSTWKYKDYIFFGTYGKGYFIWKNGVLKAMPLDKKKYLLYSHCFFPDDSGFCWISTNRGLFKAKIDELIDAYDKNSSTIYYHYFGKNDGMEMIEMNGGCNPCALQLKNKTLSFPTMDGLLWVNPEKAKPILPDGEIFIDEIIADSIRITDQTGEISLPPKTNEITVRLAFSGWCNKENIYVDYQLDDTVWRSVNTDMDAVIQLRNLASGDHTLQFRKINGFGANNYSYKTIQFSIITPWYRTWWFTLLTILAVTGLILLYVNLRTRQLKLYQLNLEEQVAEKTRELKEKNEVLEKNDSIKTRLISIISHDIVTPLKFLTAAGKNLIEKRKAMSEELQKETLEEMTNTSQDLQLLSTNILNWIKYQNENRRLAREKFNLHELVEEVTGILKSLARHKQLALINSVNSGITLYQYYEPLKILVYNLLTKAINFSERGEIIIGAEKEGDFLRIWVKDSGLGMTQDQIQHLMADEIIITAANVDKRKGHGLGYLIIKDLLKMTGGTINMKSEKERGSLISIVLPATQKNQQKENNL